MTTAIVLTVLVLFVALWIVLLWPAPSDSYSIRRAPTPPPNLLPGEHVHRIEHPARHILTSEGVFIPDLTPEEHDLLRVTPREWADEAASKVERLVARARYYTRNPPNYPRHSWFRERRMLIDDGHEQWLLWMTHDTLKEDQ